MISYIEEDIVFNVFQFQLLPGRQHARGLDHHDGHDDQDGRVLHLGLDHQGAAATGCRVGLGTFSLHASDVSDVQKKNFDFSPVLSSPPSPCWTQSAVFHPPLPPQ